MSSTQATKIRIATRASQLALWQAEHVAQLLTQAAPDSKVALVRLTTTGDRDRQSALSEMGGVGVFTREIQRAVLEGQADIAVHSLKDLPTESVDGLQLAAVPERAPVNDALVLPSGSAFDDSEVEAAQPSEKSGEEPTRGRAAGFAGIPHSARVGSGSLRRQAQLRYHRPDLEFLEMRGNVETRLRKLDDGQCDALILAVAGLRRLHLGHRISQVLDPRLVYPAVGQGALGIECRSDDAKCLALLQNLSDPPTFWSVTAERALLATLRAGCHAPVGVYTTTAGDLLTVEATVLDAFGSERLVASGTAPRNEAAELGCRVARSLLAQGAARLIGASEAQS